MPAREPNKRHVCPGVVTGGSLGNEGRRFLEAVPNLRLDKPFDNRVLRSAVAAAVSRIDET